MAATEPDCEEITYLEGGDAYAVSTLSELQCINEHGLDEDYVLTDDIEASDTEDWNDGDGFEPIGDNDDAFEGSFDGDGFTILDLYINQSGGSDVGLFGVMNEDATIEDVHLEDATVSGEENVGGLVGRTTGGSVTDVSATVTVESDENSGRLIGGLIGSNNAEIESVSAEGTVTVEEGETVGGLVGYSTELGGGSGDIIDSRANVTVAAGGSENVGGLLGFADQGGGITDSSAAGTVEGEENIGGLVGSTESDVDGSFASGTVNGDKKVGGLVGWNHNGIVRNATASSPVEGDENVGGLVGLNQENAGGGLIAESFTTGTVKGEEPTIGGLVGDNAGSVERSYWDIDATNQPDSDGGTPLSTAEMTGLKATDNMDGFEFPDGEGTWHVTDDYPALEWEDTSPFHEVNITDTNSPVDEGDDLDVTAEATNWGADGEQTVTLTSDTTSTDLDHSAVDVDSGESDHSFALTWATSSGDDGDRTITVSSESDTDTESVTINASGSPSPSPSPSPDPADISTTDLSLNETEIEENESVAITATLENDGDETGTETIRFEANDDELANETVTIDGGDEKTVSVVETFNDVGEYEITAADDEVATNLSVSERELPEFTIIYVDAAYGILEPGDEERVIVTIANEGDVAGDANVTLDLEGDDQSEILELDAGRADDAEFSLIAPDEAGEYEYTISVGEAETTETMIVEGPEPEWRVSAIYSEPITAAPGADVDIWVTIENDGDGDGTVEAEFYLDEETSEIQALDIEAGDGELVQATLPAPEEEGMYDFGVVIAEGESFVDEVEGTKSVSEDAGDDDEADADDTAGDDDDEFDDGQPGFGVLAALVSIALLALTAVRRR
ncbi:GLUG motif-containing protein [Natrarchaeobius halalkaliphilus]|uniref:GLUG motif-containing protein n=1 Tax=Natrarchaeobius halalkaliphilus TaxID=1679091 RepID=UPI001404AA89|nr:GLUG motif-containing protein [Natrarchaeobius halalkaliphilus]